MIDVVLVDDQALIRAGLRGILADAGIRVIGEAADGRSAFAVIRGSRPDVVLMDLRMRSSTAWAPLPPSAQTQI